MKIWLKEHYLLIISFVILLTTIVFSAYSYISNEMATKESEREFYYNNCIGENITLPEEACANGEYFLTHKYSFFVMLTMTNGLYYIPHGVILILFIIIPAIYIVTKFFKNRMLCENLTRDSYSKTKKKLFSKAYMSSFIVPLAFLILIVIDILYTGNLTFNPEFESSSSAWSISTMEHPIMFMCLYIANFWLISIFFINCALCVCRKYHNFFIALILSLLSIFGIELFLELVVNSIICQKILHTNIGIIFNIINMVAYNDTAGIYAPIIFTLFLVILSSVCVYFSYKDREKLIIDCDQNEQE